MKAACEVAARAAGLSDTTECEAAAWALGVSDMIMIPIASLMHSTPAPQIM